MEEQKRHSGFETMRILSMVMIILMHGIGHGGLGSAAPQGSAAFWIYWLLFILARVSTNCFVMLSGYYLSERKGSVHAGRLFRIGAQVWFYSMLTFCAAVRAGAVPLSAVKLLRALLPLTSNGYWFASAYFLMYLSVPVLNAVVQSLDRRQYKTLLLVALLLQSVWGTLFYWATDVTLVNNGYSFIWFYILYFMAAYFRKYRVTVPSRLCLLAYLAASAAGLFNRMLALRVENALHLNGFVNTVNGYQALDTVIASAALFLLFQNIRIRSDYWRRWVFRLAPLSFGVYLLHDSDFTRALLWQWVDLPRFGGALLLVPVAAYFAVFLAFEPNNYFGLHKVTDSESSISRLKAFQREKGSRVIIGDSRLAHFDLDLAGQASGKTWQTLAFGGASLKENNDLLAWVLKENPDLQEAVYGLSFYTLNKSYNADRMATLEKTLANPFAYLFNLEYNVNMLTALSERLQGVQSGGAGETGDWQYPADYTDPDTGAVYPVHRTLAVYPQAILPRCRDWAVNTAQLERLYALADECAARGVKLTVVLPPMADTVLTQVCEPLGIAGEMTGTVLPALREAADAHGFALLDYEWTDRPAYDEDTQFYDGFHLDTRYGLPQWTETLFAALR